MKLISIMIVLALFAGCQKKVTKAGPCAKGFDCEQYAVDSPEVKAPPKVAAVEPAVETPKETAYLPVYFDYDKAVLTQEARQTLLAISPNFKGILVISGHCDERGSDAYNDALGMRRAETAKEYLLQHGFKSGLIKTLSFGKRRPVKSNCKDEACHAQNRRAEFKLYLKGD